MGKRSIVGRADQAICKEITDLMLDYVMGQLDPKAASAFEKHLRLCPDCHSFLNTYKKTVYLTRQFLQKRTKKVRRGRSSR